jgi:hypothetical protein
MKQETAVEEAAHTAWLNYEHVEGNLYSTCFKNGFIAGAKWQAKRMYSDMQEYAEFCIECDRREMPLLLVQDWYEHFKNKNNESTNND